MGKVVFIALAVAALAMVASCNLIFDAPPSVNDLEKIPGYFTFGGRPAYDQTQFKGKHVFVTGGSSGIGYGTALLFARFGADVVIISRDSNPKWFTGKAAAERINADEAVKENGGKVRWYKADVSNRDEMIALFAQFEKEKWIIDFAVNNAGIVGAVGVLKSITKYFGTQYDAVHNNLMGTVISLEQELQMFQKHKRDGAIVNLASVNGYRASAHGAMYASSKFGVLGLTRSAGIEHLRGVPFVRVNAIAPGFTNTSLVWQQVKLMTDDKHPKPAAEQVWEGEYITPSHPLWKELNYKIVGTCPNGDIADPLDQANMIAFLLAKESEMISGSIFVVDGMIGE